MKKYGLMLMMLLFVAKAFACSGPDCNVDGNVMYTGNVDRGDILIYDCNQGNTAVGKWVDPTSIAGLKGDKGDKGDIGLTGIGIAGQDGKNGFDGYTPIKGVDYFDGKDGTNGVDGYTPVKNVDYFDGQNGKDGVDGLNGKDGVGEKGVKGDQGLNGKDVDPKIVTDLQNTDTILDTKINNTNSIVQSQANTLQNHDSRISKLEETQYVLEAIFRLVDTKRMEVSAFFRQNFTRNTIDTVGAKVTIKLGDSYEEKLIKKINNRLDKIDKIIGNAPVIEKVVDEKGNIKSISINGNGLSVSGQF